MITFLNDDSNILTVKYSGEIFYNKIIEAIEEFSKFEYLNKELRILHDMRDAVLKITPKELNVIKTRTKDVSAKFSSFRTAYVVTKPYNTAISYLMLTMVNIRKAERKSFYTMEAAKKWLQ